MSYPWYLWHWPVLVFVAAAVGHPLRLWQSLPLTAVSGLLAALTVRLVERPVRFAPRLVASPRRSLLLAGGLTVTVLGAAVGTADLVPAPVGHGFAALPAVAAAIPPSSQVRLTAAAALEGSYAAAIEQAADVHGVPANLTPSLSAAPGFRPCRSWTDAATTSPTRPCARARTACPPAIPPWCCSGIRTPPSGSPPWTESPTLAAGGWCR